MDCSKYVDDMAQTVTLYSLVYYSLHCT